MKQCTGSKEIVELGGVIPLIALLKSGSEQTIALSVQTLWLILLERKNHEPVVCYGGMQLLIALVKKSGVMDAVKDLAAQALYMLWSEEGILPLPLPLSLLLSPLPPPPFFGVLYDTVSNCSRERIR